MHIGYARVSTDEQSTDLQIDALTKAGCEKIYTDTISGSKAERPELTRMLEHMRRGDTVVVWRLDRLGRSLKDLITLVETLQERSVNFQSLTEGFDTTTNGGKLVFHMFAALAEFERNLIRERVQAGLASARARGRLGGRPRSLSKQKIETAKKLYGSDVPIKEICETLGISRATLYRYVRPAR